MENECDQKGNHDQGYISAVSKFWTPDSESVVTEMAAIMAPKDGRIRYLIDTANLPSGSKCPAFPARPPLSLYTLSHPPIGT